MTHNAAPSDQVDGTAMKRGRWTQAATGKEPEIKLLQQGAFPRPSKRHGAIKRVK